MSEIFCFKKEDNDYYYDKKQNISEKIKRGVWLMIDRGIVKKE